jgi:hypothetical protein
MRLEIDCGEAGKQIFVAETSAELIAKLMVAQKHATLKIREQAQRIKILCRIGAKRKTK